MFTGGNVVWQCCELEKYVSICLLENIYHTLKIFIFFTKYMNDFCEIYLTLLNIFQLIKNKSTDWKINDLVRNKDKLFENTYVN